MVSRAIPIGPFRLSVHASRKRLSVEASLGGRAGRLLANGRRAAAALADGSAWPKDAYAQTLARHPPARVLDLAAPARGWAERLRALGAEVVAGSPDDLAPHGRFPIVHAVDLLTTSRSPVRAAQDLRAATAGAALVSEAYLDDLDRYGARAVVGYAGREAPFGRWVLSRSAVLRMLFDAGFDEVDVLADEAAPDRPQGWRRLTLRAAAE